MLQPRCITGDMNRSDDPWVQEVSDISKAGQVRLGRVVSVQFPLLQTSLEAFNHNISVAWGFSLSQMKGRGAHWVLM